MRYVLSTLIVFLFFTFHQANAVSSFTCSPLTIKVQDKMIILPGADQTHPTRIYFFQNISDHSLWLDHPVESHGKTNAGWSSYFQPGKWSALLLNRKDFTISCAVIQPGKVNYQPCEKVISVCIPEKMTFNSKRKGSYWLVEDKAWDEFLPALEKRGVQQQSSPPVKNSESKR